VVVGVSEKGTRRILAYGAATPDSVFHIASVTKLCLRDTVIALAPDPQRRFMQGHDRDGRGARKFGRGSRRIPGQPALPPVCENGGRLTTLSAVFAQAARRGLVWACLAVGAVTAAPEAALAQADPLPEPAYLIPDLPAGLLSYDGERFQILPVIAIVADYTFFDQDEASVGQVGVQEDTRDLRAGRLGVALRSKQRGWSLLFVVDYQEGRTRDKQIFQLYDLRLRIPVRRVTIDIGKQKQPFVFEMAGLSIVKPQQERILSPFFVTRSVGVTLSGQLAADRMTWSAGWFNDWLESGASFSDNAKDWVGRVTGLVGVSADNRNYLHLGLGLRRVGPDADLVRLSGRPESNVTDYYVDTGDFEADYVDEMGLELIAARGPFLFTAEHVAARAHAPASMDPRFSGSYALLSWMLTGEGRPYLRESGSTGPVTPASRRGAIELVARFSHLDLRGGLIDGGTLDKWHVGANWWISRQWKFGLSWGDADLARDGVVGRTRMLLGRLQWYVP
jgi:phosphate-selective porin